MSKVQTPDFISDDDMTRLERTGQVSGMPDFVPEAGIPHFIPPGLQPEQAQQPEIMDRITGVPPNIMGQRIVGAAKAVAAPIAGLGALALNAGRAAGITPLQTSEPYGIPQSLQPSTAQEEVGQRGAGIGSAAMTALSVKDLAQSASQWLKDKTDAATLFNRAAGVPTGKAGIRVSPSTGEVVTNPGQSMVRQVAAEGKNPRMEAIFARPDDVMKARTYRQLETTGKAITDTLAKSDKVLDIEVPNNAKIALAIKRAGVDSISIDNGMTFKVPSTPLEAHKLAQMIGDEIPSGAWSNVAPPTDVNEQLKDAFFQIRDQITSNVPGVEAKYKPWQEAWLYTRALAHQAERQYQGVPMIPSFARATLAPTAKRVGQGAAILGLGGAGGYAASRFIR